MQVSIPFSPNSGHRILWLGAVFDEKTVLTAPAVSPAANRWQLGLINGLRQHGVNLYLIGHLPEPYWPRGRLRIKSADARGAPGIQQQLVDYWNLPLLRKHSLSSSYCKLLGKLENQLSNTRVVVTYNADSAAVAGANYVRERYYIPWVCIVADGEAPLNADGYVFLSWGYYEACAGPKPKLHLDGGVSEIRFSSKASQTESPPGRQVVMYTGALTRHQGIKFLVQSFRKIKNPNVELWICGKGTESTVERLSAIDNRIKLLGFLSERELDHFCQQADFFVNPRPSNERCNKKNFPSKLLQYMAYGKPVITTWTDGLSPEYRTLLIVLEQETEECLAATIQEALKWDMVQWSLRADRVESFVKSHTWFAQSKKLIEWIEQQVREQYYGEVTRQ